MVSERKPAPERQLLNLIENPELSNIHRVAIKRSGFSLFSFGALKGRFSFLKKKAKDSLSARREPLDIKRINAILRSCVFILAVYFVASFVISQLSLEKTLNLSLKTKVSKDSRIAETPSPLKKVSYYLENIRSRDIFNPLPDVIIDEDGRQKPGPNLKIVEVTKDLKLVGISWKADPDAMIKDTKLNKVYFLKKGEIIGNINVKIEAIFKDRIVLSYKGEELVLD